MPTMPISPRFAFYILVPSQENIKWNPDFSNLQGKRKLVREIGEFEKSGVKLQCLTEEGKQLLVRVIGRLKKMRVREIGIPLLELLRGEGTGRSNELNVILQGVNLLREVRHCETHFTLLTGDVGIVRLPDTIVMKLKTRIEISTLGT